jgi:hypothetical protein
LIFFANVILKNPLNFIKLRHTSPLIKRFINKS